MSWSSPSAIHTYICRQSRSNDDNSYYVDDASAHMKNRQAKYFRLALRFPKLISISYFSMVILTPPVKFPDKSIKSAVTRVPHNNPF